MYLHHFLQGITPTLALISLRKDLQDRRLLYMLKKHRFNPFLKEFGIKMQERVREGE